MSTLTLLEERPGFMRSLGRTICEWRTYGEHQYMCLYMTGIVQGQLAAFQRQYDGKA